MDSRAHVFIYALQTNADIPPDFPQEIRNRPFDEGVFLPQDDANWFTRTPKYPARLLLRRGQSLVIVPHAVSGQAIVEIDLQKLLQLETGTSLLKGWLRLTTSDRVHEIVYNTRESRPLEKFLVALKRCWLNTFPSSNFCEPERYGQQLDIKFQNSLHLELDHDEHSVVQYFEPASLSERKIVLFRREQWEPGNLVLITSLNRLLWITDQYKGRRELYAISNFSVPFATIRGSVLEDSERGKYLTVEFMSGRNWRIPLHDAQSDCVRFQKRFNKLSGRAQRVVRVASH